METSVEVVEGRRNPWIWMWFTPRKVMRQIIDFDPAYRVFTLGALTGIYRLLNQAIKQGYGDFMSLPTILILCLILGSIAGILGIFISGWYFRWVGSWFGGKANAEEVRAAIAWSSMPDIVMLVLVLPFIFVYGIDWFNSAGNLSADL